MTTFEVLAGDSREVLKQYPDDHFDACVTDPPYELVGQKTSRNGSASSGDADSPYGRHGPTKARGFMGKTWDATGVAFDPELWREVYRVLKPGAHVLSFGGTRTYHRMTVAVEDAGFVIRDCLAWLYAEGFPKSRDVSKDIDRLSGAERTVVGTWKPTGTARIKSHIGASSAAAHDGYQTGELREELPITEPATDAAKQWSGWGTALKPAFEPIVLARKPFRGTVAANVLAHGTGALNIDGSRIATNDHDDGTNRPRISPMGYHGSSGAFHVPPGIDGRWPANALFDADAAAMLDEQSGIFTSDKGASQFFYQAKASRTERNAGLRGMAKHRGGSMTGAESRPGKPTNHPIRENHHPTVKPIELCRHLVKLITPPGGTVLDPFAGSGSIGCAAVVDGFSFVGVELNEDGLTVAVAERRIRFWQSKYQRSLFDGEQRAFFEAIGNDV